MSVFEFTSEQRSFQEMLRRFFADKSSSVDVRRALESDHGYDANLWKMMADQLSLQGLLVPVELGGSGASFVDLSIVFEEMGRALYCGPYLSTVGLAANLLLFVNDEEANKDYLPRIASGELIATAALDEGGLDIAAQLINDRYVLNGSLPIVLDGHLADIVIVVAKIGSAHSYFAVEASDVGYSYQILQASDLTRRLTSVELVDVPGRLIGKPGAAESTLDIISQRALLCLAAEQVGGAERCLEMAVDYAKERVQFGRAIGSFQAVKHMCAEVLLETESAKSACYFAAWQAAEESTELTISASVAKSQCSYAFSKAAAENIQIHGGIGFTWEVDCHLFFRRAISSEALFGMPEIHRARIAKALAI